MEKTNLVKLFSGSDKSIVENQVNTFLKALNKEELVEVKFTSGDGTFDVMVHYQKN
ncbi:sporulation protein Cse60 [Paenibacillus sp. NFR01]|uniref:sporulation protein Cse60 n=1 Tax=Paenibacillus sp. NFR01 TaxID=1566279 RepID=UPI0008D4D31B|nr:sporulation protein Cse60 [Paenibacillus sp. NFR01]SET56423.1 Protein of unknown function [Paenibacillus sp. NFR01]